MKLKKEFKDMYIEKTAKEKQFIPWQYIELFFTGRFCRLVVSFGIRFSSAVVAVWLSSV